MIPPVGSRWSVGAGNVYEVTGAEGGRVELTPRLLSAECIREQREFATDNRRDPDAEVAAFLRTPMTVDAQWFTRRGDVTEVL